MPSDINRLLEDCSQKTTELVAEIARYRDSRQLNEEVAESLSKTAKVLQEVQRQIAPLADVRVRRFQVLALCLLGANLAALAWVLRLLY